MKYLLFLITTQGFAGQWHWLTGSHVAADCFLVCFYPLICPLGH